MRAPLFAISERLTPTPLRPLAPLLHVKLDSKCHAPASSRAETSSRHTVCTPRPPGADRDTSVTKSVGLSRG
eukprot:2141152-Rhodomonas_salina.1